MAETKRRGRAAGAGDSIFGMNLAGWTSGTGGGARSGRPAGRAVYVGIGADVEAALTKAGVELPDWLLERALKKRGEAFFVAQGDGPLWLLLPQMRPATAGHGGLLDPCPYGLARDVTAALAASLADYGLGQLELIFVDASEEEALGAGVGLEMGAYRFRQVRQPKAAHELPKLKLTGVDTAALARGATLGTAVNLARHLVNTPAGDLNPQSMSAAVAELFAGSTTMTVDVWTGKRLEKERMGLLIGVGQGSTFGPALVHLRYRPKKARASRPLAFVGKGVTFDTGGLDIKDAGSMRLMKKDMGGSASLCGLAWWIETSGLDVACDFYLALAENSVDKDSFHPGDILTARSGLTVEIDNTDAEGRLVLADAIDVALSAKGKDAPAALIDLATLTGAMRVALGTRLGGLFATDDQLGTKLLASAQRRGDPTWRMPLYGEYLAHLKSMTAEIANAGPSRFGGAITAALFLSRFVGNTPWAHFDIYAWTDAPVGGCMEPGGNGQAVQLLANFLEVYER